MRHSRRPSFPALVALLVAAACAGPDTAVRGVVVDTLPGGIPRTTTSSPVERGRWTLVAERDISYPDGSPGELGRPSDLALADDGSVLVFEDAPPSIKVYDPAGAFVRRIGRDGAGPLEFGAGYLTVRGDTVIVQDPRLSRATFALWRTGTRLGELRTACCYYTYIDADAAGRIYLRLVTRAPDTTIAHAQSFLRFTVGSAAADTLHAYERPGLPEQKPWLVREGDLIRMAMAVPLQPTAHWTVDPVGTLLTAWSGEYSIRATRDGRDTVALFGRPWTPDPVSASERSALVEGTIERMRLQDPQGPGESTLRAAFDPALIPANRPAFVGIDVDRAGRRWIRLDTTDSTHVTFDLFSPDGRWLDVVRVPTDSWPRQSWGPVAWTRTHVAVLIEDEDGRPLVRVFAIRGP